jgi:hypothetical protein
MKWILIVACVLVGGVAEAATLRVGNTCSPSCDYTPTQLQTAFNAAACGDTVTLQEGVTYTGNPFTLTKTCTVGTPITITSAAAAGNLPASGYRMTPAYAAYLPKITSGTGTNSGVIDFGPAASDYILRFLEVGPVYRGYGTVIQVGTADGSIQYLATQQPRRIMLSQLWVHGDPVSGGKRGIDLNGSDITFRDSYVENFKGIGQDSACLGGWNSSGPILVTNNYLNCATYGFIFGGDDPQIRTHMTVTGSGTTTGAAVTMAVANHTFAELAVGMLVAIETSTPNAPTNPTAAVEFATLTTVPSSGTSGTIAWTPAVSAAPGVNARIRYDTVPSGITITRNHFAKQSLWRTDGWLTRPVLSTVTPFTTGGTLSAATRWYRIQATVDTSSGYQGNAIWSDKSAEVSAVTTGSTSRVDLTWTDISGETGYRVSRCATSGATTCDYFLTAANATSFSDTGSAGTSATFPGASAPIIKNQCELKIGRNVDIRGNIIEDHWDQQDGGMCWFKSANQADNCWTCQVSGVQLRYNIFRDGCGWIAINGREAYPQGSSPPTRAPFPPQLTNFAVTNNLVYDLTESQCVADRDAMFLNSATVDVVIAHNTIIWTLTSGKGILLVAGTEGNQHSGLIVRDNMMPKGFYGVYDLPGWQGTVPLDRAAPGWIFTKNTIAGASSGSYPANNFFPTVPQWEAAFTTYTADGVGANYVIATGSAYENAGTDGLDLGADIPQVLIETGTAISGVPYTGDPPADPPVTVDPRVRPRGPRVPGQDD